MSVRPSVTFGGAVFMPELVGGKLDSANLRARDFSAQGVGFTQISLTIRDVHFSPARLIHPTRRAGTPKSISPICAAASCFSTRRMPMPAIIR